MSSQMKREGSVRVLRRLQKEHKKSIKKVEKAREKLETRRKKMRALEAKIARLEHRVSASERGNGHGPARGGKDLVPARLIFNPKAETSGKADHGLENVVETLRLHGIRAQVCLKTSGKVARQCAREAAENNEGLVIAAGGDGTIEDVASQLVGTKTALGILPLGTMNNLARSLGIPQALDEACALIGGGITRQIDAGHVAEGEKIQTRFFLETAGLGLTGIAFPAGQDAKKGNWNKLPTAIGKLFDLQPAPVEIRLDDGQVIRANSQLVTVSNAPLTGPNFLIAPEAKMDDGLLDVAVYDRMGKAELMGYLLESSNGKHADNPKVRFYRARHVVIRSNQEMPAVSDKDAIPEHQVLDIEVIPHALTMIVGNGTGLALPVDAVPSAAPMEAGQGRPEKSLEAV